MHYHEENNYPKAVLFSTVLMVLFLLISYLIVINGPFKQEDVGVGGIVVNYGTVEQGMGDDHMNVEEPSIDAQANQALPDKVAEDNPTVKDPSNEISDKDIVTQNDEDALSVVKKDSKNVNSISTNESLSKKKPVINPNALYKGSKKEGSAKGDGTGNVPGNQGSKAGDPLSSNYGEGGSGFGNVSLSLVNRRFTTPPYIEDQGQSSGKVVVEIRVDKTGEVVFVRAGAKGTTLSDLKLWRKCEIAVMGAQLNQLDSAPDVQVGTVVFNFRVN